MSEEIVGRLREGLRASPSTLTIVESVLNVWPSHGRFLERSLLGRSAEVMDTTESIAALLVRVATEMELSLDVFADDYRYYCEKIVLEEELFFRREGRYRLSTFEEAAREVYHNPPFMKRYMHGLFVSNVLWLNHVSAMNDFAKTYLPSAPPGGAHLEIGPGHGNLLHLAIKFGTFSSLTAWDLSATSIRQTQRILALMGQSGIVDLREMDLYAPEALANHRGRFDTVVFSEVLEHLERPAEALAIIRELLTPTGRVWINVPANGPSTDHIYLLRSLDDAVAAVANAGFRIDRATGFPVTGATLERATRLELPVTCVIVATKAD